MSFELQVLEGEQQGARTALPADVPVSVSGAFDSDVVLRGAGLADRRISLLAHGQTLKLQVLQGQADVGGRMLQAGQMLEVALDTPVQLGGTRLAVVRVRDEAAHGVDADGRTGAADAADAAPRAATAAEAGTAAAAPAPTAALAAPSAARTWSRRLVAGGAALVAASVGMLAFAYSLAPSPATPEQQARRAEAVLQGAGLQRLSVRAVEGEVRVDGYLETLAQRAMAEQVLARERIPARWQVWINEQVAGAVQDVFRTHGVAAQAEATGPGAVRVRSAVADAALLETIRTAARRDVPGLAALELLNTPMPAAAAPVQVIDDPGKRVASIVPGDPPYVVTADGTRYFEGALLPTGHRIAGIEERRVLLEINGVKTPLVF